MAPRLAAFALTQPVYQTLVYRAFRCRCPFTQGEDRAVVTLSYWAVHTAVELGSLARYLASFADTAITHEAVAAEIAATVQREVGVQVRVEMRFLPTEGIEATVVAGAA